MTWARFRPSYKNLITVVFIAVATVGLFAPPVYADAQSDCNGKYTGTGPKVAQLRAACVKGHSTKIVCADLPREANATKAEIKEACDFGYAAGSIALGGDLLAAGAEGAAEDEDAVCTAGALGWVFCPLMEFISTATTATAELLEGQLIFRPLTSTQGNAIRAIWGVVLGIANTGLAVAFLVVIFSQSTSIGLSKYGIKTILPRIIAVAILMNLSFWICAIAVDISNILGVSVRDIINVGMATIDSSKTDVNIAAGASYTEGIGAIIASLLVAVTAAALGLLPLLLPILAAGLVAVVTAFIILSVRQVLIMLLIIVAPLAFLAWILPNTEEWFTKWRKFFTALLLMFPIIMAIFYGSLLVSKVILATGEGGADGNVGFMTNLIAFVVLIVPLFSLPFIMKTAGGVLERFGLLVNNKNKGLVDRARKKGDEMYKRGSYARGRAIRGQAKQDFRNKRFAERLNLANKSLEDFKKENGGSLTPAQLAQWTRAQHTKGMAGGVGEIARMSGRTAERAATKGVGGLYGVSPTLGDLGAQAVVGAGSVVRGAAGKVPGGDMRKAQTEALNRGAQAQEAKAFNERVASIQTTYDNMGAAGADTKQHDPTTGAGYLEGQYKQAITTGNHEQAAAVINRLSSLGAGGRNRLSNMLQTHEVKDDKMKDTITKAVVQDNYQALVGSRSDAAKGKFGTNGKWDPTDALGAVGTGQLATQDEKTLYQRFGDISQTEAAKIISEPNLESTVQNGRARAILEARAAGLTALPTTGDINPSDPTLGTWDKLAS